MRLLSNTSHLGKKAFLTFKYSKTCLKNLMKIKSQKPGLDKLKFYASLIIVFFHA